MPARGRGALELWAGDVAVALATTRSTSPTSPRPARSGATARCYGGNATMGKSCYSLRIASGDGPRRGWLASNADLKLI